MVGGSSGGTETGVMMDFTKLSPCGKQALGGRQEGIPSFYSFSNKCIICII